MAQENYRLTEESKTRLLGKLVNLLAEIDNPDTLKVASHIYHRAIFGEDLKARFGYESKEFKPIIEVLERKNIIIHKKYSDDNNLYMITNYGKTVVGFLYSVKNLIEQTPKDQLRSDLLESKNEILHLLYNLE